MAQPVGKEQMTREAVYIILTRGERDFAAAQEHETFSAATAGAGNDDDGGDVGFPWK